MFCFRSQKLSIPCLHLSRHRFDHRKEPVVIRPKPAVRAFGHIQCGQIRTVAVPLRNRIAPLRSAAALQLKKYVAEFSWMKRDYLPNECEAFALAHRIFSEVE